MSSPSSVGGNNGSVGIREGTRVILREITANLQNSPPSQSPRRKSGNEASPLKGEPQQQPQQQQQQQHDVKVRFIREFADVGSTVREATTESSISSASSFQSLTSTLSSKCSSGICVDSSPGKASDTSYLSADIPGLDDLISACENIRLADTTVDSSKEQSFSLHLDGEDLSGDQTFASANDGLDLDRTRELSRGNSPIDYPRCAENIEGVAGELDRTRTFDGEFTGELERTRTFDGEFTGELERTRTLEAEAERVDPAEAETRYLRADSEIEKSVDLTFVQCSSTLAQEIPIVLVNGGNADVSREAPEILSELASVETDVDEKFDQSQSALAESEKLDQSQRTTLPEIEKVDQSQPEILAEIGQFDQSQPTLAEIVEKLPEPLIDISAEEAKRLILNETIELSTPEFFDEAKRLIQLDKTIELSTPQFFNFAQRSTDLESSDFTVEGAARSEKFPEIDSLRASTLSDIGEISESSTLPSLPSLSSVRLPAEVSETADEIHVSEPTNEKTAASLSEKFAQIVAQIAANDICTANSISAVKEPTFLNSQRNANDSADSQENKSDESIEKADDIIISRERNTIERIAEIQSRELEIESADAAGEKIEEISRIAERVRNVEAAPSPVKTEARAVVKVEPEEAIVRGFVEKREADSSAGSEDLNATVTVHDISAGNLFSVPESDQYAEFLPQQQSTGLVLDRRRFESNQSGTPEIAGAASIIGDNFASRPISLNDEYAAFVPQKQSTSLTACFGEPLNKVERQATPFVTALLPPNESSFNGEIPTSPKNPPVDDRCNFAKLEIAAHAVANDIYNKSLELEEESDRFVSATGTELFVDPGGFDFLLSKTPRKNSNSNLRTESLYIKFDPLVSNTSMLPQGNIHNTSPPVNEERNGENNTTIANLGTPKRNPALAAIDRLLFYSPMTNNTPTTNTATIQKTNDVQEKVEPTEETSAETVNMAKELELVRSTVIQLEDQLEKLKIDNEEKQTSYQEKINQLQAQLAQEIKNKNQITVVVDEYEKSISRLVAERERDRKNLDLEKAKLQEELAAAKHHLDNTEAAFNDVHLKYERLKAVVATYKSNEIALKESLQENVEIIKSLENRYEQVKSHATARLEKANQDLDSIRKQNESETVRLHAMLRKAELKSNSLAELVEQKTKENKELTQILDEVIARVGRKQSE